MGYEKCYGNILNEPIALNWSEQKVCNYIKAIKISLFTLEQKQITAAFINVYGIRLDMWNLVCLRKGCSFLTQSK